MGFTPLAENHLRESLIRSSFDRYALHRSKTGEPMSALGHKRTSDLVCVMSALAPKADIDRDGGNVRSVPQAYIAAASR
jgi:hypothetical protein